MNRNLPMLAMLAAVIALAGCNRKATDDTVADASPEPVTTPNEAASQTPEPMPETQSTATTATPGTGMPGTPNPPSMLAASTTPHAGGVYLTDGAGTAVYMLEGNTDGSKCTGACLEAWPPLLVTGEQPSAGTNLQADKVGTIRRPDGATQITYNGHPLHRYAADTGAGRTAGHGVKDQWGTWHLVSPQGDKVAMAH